MKLISTVSSEHDGLGWDYALIDLNPDAAKLALGRVSKFLAQKKDDPQLDEMYFWDYHVDYFSPWNAEEEDRSDSIDATLDKLSSGGVELIRPPDDFALPENLVARVECSQMVVRNDGISFIAIPKHGSHYIRTSEIPLALLRDAVAG